MSVDAEIGKGLLDMRGYRLPGGRGRDPGIPKLHLPVPRNSGSVIFDIYDYEFLFNDGETKGLIRDGETIGCFYIESPGMRSLLKRLSCDTFEMLTAASSVIRPGVAESGMMQEFIARHKDPARRKYLVPEMEEYLGETYGVMIYQEDVIKVAHHIAGLTLEEADLLRRAMSGKMRSRTAMRQISENFFLSCSRKGLSAKTAEELWRQIESFAGYAFCKAHSASFALLSFQVAYLKAHYPAEFMAGVLSNGGGYYSPAVYIQESKRLGLEIRLPCVNESRYEYCGEGGGIRIGLIAVKNLSRGSADKIISERKKNGRYVSLADFLARTGTGYEEAAILIKCGAMDCFAETRPTLMRLLDICLHYREILYKSCNDLFAADAFRLENKIVTSRQYALEEICAIEYETFGYMVTRHPLEFFGETVNRKDIVKAGEMKRHNRQRVKMVGWYMASKRIKTRGGKIMKFLSLEDLTGTFEAVIFPEIYARYAEKTMSMGPYLIEGDIDIDGGNNIIVKKLGLLANENIMRRTEKDSAENNYFGDAEKVSEEEFMTIRSLDREKLKAAYL